MGVVQVSFATLSVLLHHMTFQVCNCDVVYCVAMETIVDVNSSNIKIRYCVTPSVNGFN